MTRLRLIVAMIVLIVVPFGVVAAGRSPRTSRPEAPAPTVVPVVGASVTCPDLRQRGTGVHTRVGVGVLAADEGADPAAPTGGSLVARPLHAVGPAVGLPISLPGQVATDVAPGVDEDALVVTARGPLAAGLEVEQLTRMTTGVERGLAAVRCTAAGPRFWFVGGSTRVGDATVLVLVNPDDTPALVDVTTWTSEGPVDARPGHGIPVPPRSRVTVAGEVLAPDAELLALRVVASRGRVSAALRHARGDARTPLGVDWVPPSQPPARVVVVPGLPGGPGRRVLDITNPGAAATVVAVQVTTAGAQFVPPGLDALRVPAGTGVAIDLTPLTDEGGLTVRVTSGQTPVLAGAFVHDSQGRSPTKDFAYAGSALALRGPALLPDVGADRSTSSTLLLTAPDSAAEVDVGLVGESGVARRLYVSAGRTVAFDLGTLARPGFPEHFAVVVTPAAGAGPVYAARYVRERGERGPLTTLLDLSSAVRRVERPGVRLDPSVGVSR